MKLAIAALSLWALAFHAAASPESDKPCAEAEASVRAKSLDAALDGFARCAAFDGQEPFMIARAHLGRLAIFESRSDAVQAEAELVKLTSPPVANYTVFNTRFSPETASVFGVDRTSVGITQPRLLVRLGAYRATANDMPGAISLSERALRLALATPEVLEDSSAALTLRAKALIAVKNEQGAIADIVRAYVRGTKDEWVLEQAKKFPADAQETMGKLREVMGGAVLKIALSNSPISGETPDARQRSIAEAKSAIARVEAQEVSLVGPLGWTTQ